VDKRVLAALLAGTWSFRLTRHLWIRLAGHDQEDGRYQAMREHWREGADVGLFWFFLVQALVAFLFALPAWVVANDPSSGLDAWVIAGVAVWLISLTGESIADRQLAAFRADPGNRGKVRRSGSPGWRRC
jgi:steroid 5-alpha reductase family enzyme